MSSFKIALVAKNTDSFLTRFLFNQLSSISWIDCKTLAFQDIRQAGDSDFFLTVPENASLRELLDISAYYRKENKKSIGFSYWNNKLVAGPTHIPGQTAGIDSCFVVLQQEAAGKQPGLKEIITPQVTEAQFHEAPDVFYTAFTSLLNELKILYQDQPEQKLKFVDTVTLFSLVQKDEITSVSKYIYPVFEGSTGAAGGNSLLDYKILLRKYLNSLEHSRTHKKKNLFVGQPDGEDKPDEYRNVAVVGGGTAGYLTALALKKEYPHLPVTLIESSKIPVIGVGEATTPEIRRFLFETLHFPPHEFYDAVKPTWKLGIRFFWGLPGDYYFNYPFGQPDVRSAYLTEGHINNSSLTAVLMDQQASFVVSATDRGGREQYSALSDDLFYALHLDNESFIRYLKTKATEAGILYIDDLITDAERQENGDGIKAVIGETGKRYEYDFFVDCSGFRSLLLEKILGSDFTSYKSSLFNDTAVTGCIQNPGRINTYTLAESMNHGWCWNIPMRGENHRGYVFSSAHASIDEAAAELQAKNPGIGNLKTVKFRSGRHQEICIGNVFAIGNSFAFVEPLESTGIHMILKEVKLLAYNFPELKRSPALRRQINTHMNEHWDFLRGFLAIHYKYNKKFDTPYWKDCRAETDISNIQWLTELYYDIGPLTYADRSLVRMIMPDMKDDIFGLIGFDVLMLGQGEIPKNFNRALQNRQLWEANVRTWKSIRSMTVPVEKDLDILNEYLESRW
ncbi:MAG: tryptophan halogenase family protein [Chitinophagaceae bacterium]